MERGLIMAFHAIVIALILYIFMLFVLKQPAQVAEDRSVLLGAIVLIYMILFGHGLPNSVNKNIA
jgi:hypothetical protein